MYRKLLHIFLFVSLTTCQLSPSILEKTIEKISWIETWAPIKNSSIYQDNCERSCCDAIFFNGITCSTKHQFACDAVMDLQGDDGRFYRNIWFKGKIISNSFSRDMAYGVLLALIETKRKDVMKKWISYINLNKRLCVDEKYNPNCEIRIGTYCAFNLVLEYLEMDKMDYKLVVPHTSEWLIDETCKYYYEYANIEAEALTRTSPLNLIGLQILIRRNVKTVNITDYQQVADTLYSKFPRNYFFRYLSQGISDELVIDSLKDLPEDPSHPYVCWVFAHTDIESCFVQNLGWDYIFLFSDIVNNNK